MRTEWCFRLGGRFQPVREFLLEVDKYPQWYQGLERRIGRVSVVRNGPEMEPQDDDSTDRFIARILIGLLQRGDATTISPFIEAEVLEALLGLDRITTPDGLGWKYDAGAVPALSPETLLGALCQSVESILPQGLGDFDSYAEEAAFRLHLDDLLGRGMAFLDLQRPMMTMVPDTRHISAVQEQRVDFVIETPTGLKLVIEIDGSQHLESKHVESDRIRDERLRQAGWVVERIPASRVQDSASLFSPGLRELVARDESIRIANSANVSEQARQLAWIPHEIHRFQLAILLAIYNGDISLEDEHWTIVSVDRDHCVAELALKDLHLSLRQLTSLYGVPGPPRVNLLRIGSDDSERIATQPYQFVVTTEVTRDDLDLRMIDLIVDASVSVLHGDMRADSSTVVDARHLPGHTATYSVMTAPFLAPVTELPWLKPRPIAITRDSRRALRYFLQVLFRRSEFRPMQREIIERAMLRKDVLGLLPTGGGKSLTFHMATLLSPGIAIVVAPTKSLIDDQVFNLHLLGINRVESIHSGKSAREKGRSLSTITSGAPRFVYIAPERFQSDVFRTELKNSPVRGSVVFGVIDEAHCVSEWGHQFRPSYLMVGRHARKMFAPPDTVVPLISLTATASSTVLNDIQRELDFDIRDEDSIIEVVSHARDNLNFVPIQRPDSQKHFGLHDAINSVASHLEIPEDSLLSDASTAGVVFCRYVNGEYGVAGVHAGLAKRFGEDNVQMYAGSKPKSYSSGIDWDQHKSRVQRGFKTDQFPMLVTTSAFGMGVDKGNIRYTIHYGIPDSTEALVQESGRCGRDGRKAVCAVVYSAAPNADEILKPELDSSEIAKRIQGWDSPSDVKRILFLNSLSYPGVDVELRSLVSAFGQIVEAWNRDQVAIGSTMQVPLRPRHGGWEALEKAVYRLSILGIVDDYTIDWASRLVHVETVRVSLDQLSKNLLAYFGRYPHAQFRRAVTLEQRLYSDPDNGFEIAFRDLIAFTYDQLERARRQALSNLIGFLEEANSDGEKLRELITAFLTRNNFTAIARSLSSQPEEDNWFGVLDQIQNERERQELARAVQRQLETEANHPGLRLVYLLSSASDPGFTADDIVSELATVVSDYQQDSSRTRDDLDQLLARATESLHAPVSGQFDEVVLKVSRLSWSEAFLRAALPYARSPEAVAVCSIPDLRNVLRSSQRIFALAEERV